MIISPQARKAADHPDDIPAKFAVANFALGQKDWGRAKSLYEGLLTPDRAGDPLILNNLAVIYQRDNDSRALEYAQRAHTVAPQNVAITDTLGWIMVQKGDADIAVDLQASDVPALASRGKVRIESTPQSNGFTMIAFGSTPMTARKRIWTLVITNASRACTRPSWITPPRAVSTATSSPANAAGNTWAPPSR